ncbi:MAG: hypothetical protein K2O24_09475 [Muribaculaceae bacterium]|nr:hypothetical protein [Muribaculaceae bacterium]
MSRARLKKILAEMPAEQMAEMVLELYDARKDAREYLEFWQEPDAQKALEKARKGVEKVFFTSPDRPRRRPSLTDLNKIVKDFTTMVFDRVPVADLLIHVAETQADWLDTRWRRLSYRTSLHKHIDTAALYLEQAFPDNPDGTPDPEGEGLALRLSRARDHAAALYPYRW